MSMRSLLVGSAFILCASVGYVDGSYQPTKDGKTLIWNASPRRGEAATWSGKRDKHGFATGSGTLTWYRVTPTFVTGSLIPDTRRYAVIGRYSGRMVHGKWKGAVTHVDSNGKRLPATGVSRQSRERSPQKRRNLVKKTTPASIPSVTVTPTGAQTPAPIASFTATPTVEQTPATITSVTVTPVVEQTPPPAPAEGPSPGAQEPFATVSRQTAPAASAQRAVEPATPSPQFKPVPAPPDHSPGPPTASSPPLLKPPPDVDEQTVATFDTVYQKAIAANDAAIMDQILADDFVFVTDRGVSLTKADLLKEARDQRTIYETQEEEEGTQKVRIWRDTAVVTALLRVKGRRDENPFDYEVWVNEIYVRTPTGWRYVFGRAAIPSPRSDVK